MRVRIMDDGQGGWRAEDNPDWRNRSPQEIRAILDNAGAAA